MATSSPGLIALKERVSGVGTGLRLVSYQGPPIRGFPSQKLQYASPHLSSLLKGQTFTPPSSSRPFRLQVRSKQGRWNLQVARKTSFFDLKDDSPTTSALEAPAKTTAQPDAPFLTPPQHEEGACAVEDGSSADAQTNTLESDDPETSYGLTPEEEALEPTLSIIIAGASGALARTKIFPALFALYYKDCLPENFQIFGYARTPWDDETLRSTISENLTCRIDAGAECGKKLDDFLSRCFYETGNYDCCSGMVKLNERLKEAEGRRPGNRVFYLSVPPGCVTDVASCLSVNAISKTGFTRVILEKPFGKDAASSAEMLAELSDHLSNDQVYRIDHYLGKELIENLSVLRFSNLIFGPLWSRRYIKNVQIVHCLDEGVEPHRAKYFDEYGIIRDVLANHLLQTLALFAIEEPVSQNAEDFRDEKVKVLRSIRPPRLEDVSLGQYKRLGKKDGTEVFPGYQEEPGVRTGSATATFAALVCYIDNARWDGVPFLLKAGYALSSHRAEIRIQFNNVPGNIYKNMLGFDGESACNELIIRLEPDEAIYLKINNKVPGLGLQLDRSNLNLLYRDEFDEEVPAAYERQLLDVINGDQRLFIRHDELNATWKFLTPLLQDIEKHRMSPELYTHGTRGPVGAYYLAAKHGVRWAEIDD